jgi:hypothetical protein
MKPGETKDPSNEIAKYVYVDRTALRQRRLVEIRGLYEKVKTRTITQSEKDELLGLLVEEVIGR